jgi:hypothetical protein
LFLNEGHGGNTTEYKSFFDLTKFLIYSAIYGFT